MNYQIMATTDKPIIIQGETGTGKTFLAKKLHLMSLRKNQPFIQLNIASLNENLFESELFGHKKGAFSGAYVEKVGFCEQAGKGTLFLDEIGELSLSLQVKLLTLLEEGWYYPVGGKEKKTFKGRLIFATNKNMEKMVEEGSFRRDLYYRLRFFSVELRPLRQENSLFKIIFETIQSKQIEYGYSLNLTQDLINQLVSYDWPGNYRELISTIEYFYCLRKKQVTSQDAPHWLHGANTNKNYYNKHKGSYRSYIQEIEDFEQHYFNILMEKTSGRINKAVAYSGLSKPTIISKLKKYAINRKDFIEKEKVVKAHGF
ncbi:MAG: sigma 54-interacting transcriptional regulator [Bacteriovoracaceae bacterium]|nr:sigma 54-interacting transcriptional regulator [Bacteriovoracaceae bacterium]